MHRQKKNYLKILITFIGICLLRHRREQHSVAGSVDVSLAMMVVARQQPLRLHGHAPSFWTHVWIWLRPTRRACRSHSSPVWMVSGLRHHSRQPIRSLARTPEWDNNPDYPSVCCQWRLGFQLCSATPLTSTINLCGSFLISLPRKTQVGLRVHCPLAWQVMCPCPSVMM